MRKAKAIYSELERVSYYYMCGGRDSKTSREGRNL